MDTEHFNQAAASWDDNPHRRELTATIAAAIAERLPLGPQTRLLDYGCGTGALGCLLADRVAAVTAADPSEGMIARLRAKLVDSPDLAAKITPLHLDPPTQTALGPGRWDAVASAMVLHHVQDAAGLIAQLAERLAPNGWMALADLETEDGTFHGRQVPHTGFAPDTVADWMRQAGLEAVRIGTIHRIAKPGADGADRVYPVFLAVGRRD